MHGGIDGFSRRLIWLEVGTTNNNPEVITKFYLDAVKQVGGLPRKVRSDDGTENSMVAAVHTFLRSSHSDEDAGLGCFLTGRSTANQRIEALVTSSQGWSWMVDNFFLKIYVTSVYLMTQIQFMLIAFGFVSCLFEGKSSIKWRNCEINTLYHQANLETVVVRAEDLILCFFTASVQYR